MDWQTFVSLLIVLFAAAMVVRWCWRIAHGASSGCAAGCHHCPSNPKRNAHSGNELVELKGPSSRSPGRP